MPLAERLTFVDNGEYILQGTLSADTLDFSQRSPNRLSLALKDTVVGSLSVSVFDADFDEGTRAENIFSELLLTSDLRGYVHHPSWYFNPGKDSVQMALDLVMMTNGWRRFQWKQLANNLGEKKYNDPGYISLSGQVNLEGTKKPFAEKQLMVFIITADSSRQVEMITTDKEGRFQMDSLVFFNKARVLFSDIRGRKSRFIEVKLSGDSLTRNYALPPLDWSEWPRANAAEIAAATKRAQEYAASIKAEGEMLEEVIVKGVRKTKLQEFEEKYVSGLFSGDATRKMDFLEEDLGPYANVFDYLISRVPGLSIVQPNYMDETDPDGAGYRIFYRQSASVSSMGNIPMSIFLDEVQVDANVVANLPANQIAMIKIYSNFVGAAGGGAGGAMAIYTKRGADLLNTMETSGDMVLSPGYTVMKEFYSPDYSTRRGEEKPDNRLTLLWNPSIIVAGVNPIIPIRFFNNDRTKRFRVVVEGMTADGKMLMIEQTFGAKKAF